MKIFQRKSVNLLQGNKTARFGLFLNTVIPKLKKKTQKQDI